MTLRTQHNLGNRADMLSCRYRMQIVIGRRTACAAMALLYLSGCAAQRRPFLEAACGAAAWIRSVEQVTAAGKAWPPAPDEPERLETNLYAGAAGVVLFFLEGHASTGDPKWLADARAGADDLLARISEQAGPQDAGLYTGLAGVGFALLETYEATGDEKYRAGVERVVATLRAAARQAGDGIEWSNVTDIIAGSAGTGLFLLDAARRLDLPEAEKLAVAAGRRLIALGRTTDEGTSWAMSPDYPREMPNFSHGTGGIAYFLATLHRETGERAFLDAAQAGARYLLSIADTGDGGCRIFHHRPGGEELFYLGWCHGPVGTARLFYRLAEVTEDPSWMDWVRRSARSVMAAGLPQDGTSGYWNNVGQCCGSAGVADFFLDLHRVTGDPAYLAFAKRIAADVLRRATSIADGLKWIQAEHRVRPQLLAAQTGTMQGAAGIGMMFLHLDAADHDRRVNNTAGRPPDRATPPTIAFPDAPFEHRPPAPDLQQPTPQAPEPDVSVGGSPRTGSVTLSAGLIRAPRASP